MSGRESGWGLNAGRETRARTHFAKAPCLSPPGGARGRAPGLGVGGRLVPPAPLRCPSRPSSPFWAPPGSDGSGRDREHRPLRGRLRSPRDPRPALPSRSCSLRAPWVSDPHSEPPPAEPSSLPYLWIIPLLARDPRSPPQAVCRGCSGNLSPSLPPHPPPAPSICSCVPHSPPPFARPFLRAPSTAFIPLCSIPPPTGKAPLLPHQPHCLSNHPKAS